MTISQTKSINTEGNDNITDTESEDKDNPNAAQNSNDKFDKDSLFNNDSDIEEMMNNPSNDSAMELHSMLNFPDLLDVTK